MNANHISTFESPDFLLTNIDASNPSFSLGQPKQQQQQQQQQQFFQSQNLYNQQQLYVLPGNSYNYITPRNSQQFLPEENAGFSQGKTAESSFLMDRVPAPAMSAQDGFLSMGSQQQQQQQQTMSIYNNLLVSGQQLQPSTQASQAAVPAPQHAMQYPFTQPQHDQLPQQINPNVFPAQVMNFQNTTNDQDESYNGMRQLEEVTTPVSPYFPSSSLVENNQQIGATTSMTAAAAAQQGSTFRNSLSYESLIFKQNYLTSPLETPEYDTESGVQFKDISHRKSKSVGNISDNAEKYTSQPGPIPAAAPELTRDELTGEENLTFYYSKKKIIRKFTLKCPKIDFKDTLDYGDHFIAENCIYPGAMVPPEEYKGNRGKYERECNYIGWKLAYLNPIIRNQRGLIQRAVDSWRNTRPDQKIRSRRVRKQTRIMNKRFHSVY
ncbi:hypothetical protein PACTADRAFT_32634 [Pachysolen tannophilus NRRL Y-2460]|uniref:DUF8032 domain-containing protein n=1 Tax=Pachysolen tannophilus NRRL Y-2460 TaxID=669874 RepID=A0A1E4TZI2_PACTA|nr:hypothetical protein PACTADRAFT_32634 [Pachysolen tannophilus NRRL Y-2460]